MEICFVTPRCPFPLTRGDQKRAYHQIRGLSSRHTITLVCGSDDDVPAAHRAELERWCRHIEIVRIGKLESLARTAWGLLGSPLPMQVLFFQSPHLHARLRAVLASRRFDIVHASLIRVLPHVWSIEAPPVLADLMDTLSLSVARRKAVASPLLRPLYELERRRLVALERLACLRFRRLAVTGQADRDALDSDRVRLVADGVDLPAFPYRPDPRDGSTIIMTGNMGYQPNVDAAGWFAREIWPRVRAARADVRVRIVGARPARAVRALQAVPGIGVCGPVPNIAHDLHLASVAVCPMRCGAGIQNKLLEALATGTPAVATTLANQGVEAVPERDALIADEPVTFANQILRLLEDGALRQRLAQNGRRYVEGRFAWEQHVELLEELYRELGASA